MDKFRDLFRSRPPVEESEPDDRGLEFFEDPFDGHAVRIPVEDSIDLHTFDPAQTRDVLEAYLDEVCRFGFASVRIIHGKGSGVQRRIVRAFLDRHPFVTEYHDAPEDRGGWGATVVYMDADRNS
ncbi:Smr/MutS family protein [bacterium]|nr:Smr/MutS family protein [candidate division CSSED10-310 bacterium]